MQEEWPRTWHESMQRESKEQGKKVCNKRSKELEGMKKCGKELGGNIGKKGSKELC